MSKAALAAAIEAKTGISKSNAGAAVEAVMETIAKALKKEGRFTIPGFGTFSVRKRAARAGRNPATGEAIKIKASKAVGFRAGTFLKASIKRP